jgi:hypothetical protein
VWIKNEKGLSSAEILISVAFMGIMVFFSYQMLNRQKKMVVKVNQNVEATTVLFDMRKSLSGPGCKENLSGYGRILVAGNIQSLKKLVTYQDGTSTVQNIYGVNDSQPEPFSKTGLSIQSYELNPRGIAESLMPDKTYLIVNFNRGEVEGTLRRQIRVYTQETNGVITNCSLVPFARDAGSWTQVGKELHLKVKSVGIGTSELTTKFSLKGGLYATPPVGGCNNQTYGSFYFNSEYGRWELCTNRGVLPLTDRRKIP